jgi:carboxyl-terminal processing protease
MMKRPLSKALWIGAALSCGVAATLALAAGMQRGEAYRYLKVFQEVWSLTEASYVEPVDEGELLEGAYRGMLASVDAATGYLSDDDAALMEQPPGPAGVGMELLPSGGMFVVVRIDPGGPAAEAGLERGDQIWQVDGRSVRGVPWPVVHRWVRGPEGRSLELTVLDGRHFELRDVTVELALPASPGHRVEARGDVLHVRIGDLGRLDPDRLRADLSQASGSGKPVLLDLRGSMSVSPAHVTRLAGLLVPGGTLLELEDADGKRRSVKAPSGAPVLEGSRTFVLVDSSTAGMAEALAGLIRERGGARLCGRPTYGLAGLPTKIELSSGVHVLLTTELAHLPGGSSWAEDGLEPDHELEAVRAGRDDDGDPMLEAALEWIRSGAAEEAAKAA